MSSSSTRTIKIPDQRKLELCKQTPELGPRILFFSGGTALRETSRELIRYTHNSIHLITPFDSGGSSAVLREAFGMPAVGDIRNRLMALADQSVKGNPEIFELFTYRLSKTAEQNELQKELRDMAEANNPLVRSIPAPMRRVICNHFKNFIKLMPPDFNLKGASIGNLVLTAGYLTNRRQLDPVIDIFHVLLTYMAASVQLSTRTFICRPTPKRQYRCRTTQHHGKRSRSARIGHYRHLADKFARQRQAGRDASQPQNPGLYR